MGNFISFSCAGWESGLVLVADSFWLRLRGLIPRATHGLLIRGPSVHAFGMRHSLEVVGLDEGMKVVEIRTLKPSSMMHMRAVRWLLELPEGSQTPEIGSTIILG